MTRFPASYSEATDRFVEVCGARGIRCSSFPMDLRGPAGEPLATHVAYIGRPDCERVLIVNCGTHGVEGLAGSACMTAWLAEGLVGVTENVALLLVHLINPWGTAWRRRQTEGNVDLNRNFVDFTLVRPLNERYEQLRTMLGLRVGEPWSVLRQILEQFEREQGQDGLAEAVFRGQYQDPRGPGFGGHRPAWSNLTFRGILTRYAAQARRVAFIDVHTGLGSFAHGTLLSTDASGSASLELARQWYGPEIDCLKDPGRKMPYDIQGDIAPAVKQTLPRARVTAVTLEFGTFALDRFMELQIRDCGLYRPGAAHTPQVEEIRAALQEFFCPPVRDWEHNVISRALQVFKQAADGLRASD